MQFHPVEPVLITAGEDGTAKLWHLNGAAVSSRNSSSSTSPDSKVATSPPHSAILSDLEPAYTFRGHK